MARSKAGTRKQLVRAGRSRESDSADFAPRQREHNQHLLHQDGSRSGDRCDGKTRTGAAGNLIWQRNGNRRLEDSGIPCRQLAIFQRFRMEALGRVELPTNGLGNRCSIHLSYRATRREKALLLEFTAVSKAGAARNMSSA